MTSPITHSKAIIAVAYYFNDTGEKKLFLTTPIGADFCYSDITGK